MRQCEEVAGQLSVTFEARQAARGTRSSGVELEVPHPRFPSTGRFPLCFAAARSTLNHRSNVIQGIQRRSSRVMTLTYRFVGGDVDGKAVPEGPTPCRGEGPRAGSSGCLRDATRARARCIIRCDRRVYPRKCCVAMSLPQPPVRPSLTPITTGERITGVSVVANAFAHYSYHQGGRSRPSRLTTPAAFR